MLRSLRSGAASWVVKILLGLLVASFALWGIGDIFRTGAAPSTVVAEVGDVEVGAATLDRELRVLQAQLPPNLDVRAARDLLLEEALGRAVDSAAIELAAEDFGLRVDEEQLRAFVASFPPGALRAEARRLGMSDAQYVEALRSRLVTSEIQEAVGRGAAPPRILAEALYVYRNVERGGTGVFVPYADVEVPEPSEEELAAFRQERAAAYTAPELRRVAMATLALEDAAAAVAVDEAELQALYETNRAQYERPAEVDLTQVVAPDQETAQRIAAAVSAGQSLENAAQAEGLEATIQENVTRATLLPEIADAVFAAEPDAAPAPIETPLVQVETPLGWFVARIDDATPAQAQPFEEVRDEIEQAYRLNEAAIPLYERQNEILDRLASGQSLDEVAAQKGLRLETLPPMNPSGRTVEGAPAADLPYLDQIAAAAFALEQGQTSDLPIQTPGGDYVFLRVDETIPSALRPLEDVREQVVADWRAAKAQEIAAARAAEAAAALAEGAEPAVVAAQIGGDVREIAPIPREGLGVDPRIANALFSVAPGETAVATLNDGALALRVGDAQAPDVGVEADQVDALADSLSLRLGVDLRAQYAAGLRDRYGVEIDRAVVDRLYPEAP